MSLWHCKPREVTGKSKQATTFGWMIPQRAARSVWGTDGFRPEAQNETVRLGELPKNQMAEAPLLGCCTTVI